MRLTTPSPSAFFVLSSSCRIRCHFGHEGNSKITLLEPRAISLPQNHQNHLVAIQSIQKNHQKPSVVGSPFQILFNFCSSFLHQSGNGHPIPDVFILSQSGEPITRNQQKLGTPSSKTNLHRRIRSGSPATSSWRRPSPASRPRPRPRSPRRCSSKWGGNRWRFSINWGYPQIIYFKGIFHNKPSINGGIPPKWLVYNGRSH